jgi:hypothetical protein
MLHSHETRIDVTTEPTHRSEAVRSTVGGMRLEDRINPSATFDYPLLLVAIMIVAATAVASVVKL